MTYIYLSGPIAHLTYRQATEWRRWVAVELEEDYSDVEVLDPMRDVEADPDTVIGSADANSYSIGSVDTAMLTDRGIVTRDFQDTCRADLVIANLLDTKSVSIGTIAELAWAYDRRIPTVVITEPGNPHEHPFVREFSSYRVATVEAAIEVTKSVLALRPY